MKIVVQNQSTLVAAADAELMAAAEKVALDAFAADWNREPSEVGFTTDPASADLGEADCLIVLLDDADQAGALGYHATDPDGRAYARVFVRDSIAGLRSVDPKSVTGTQPQEVVFTTVLSVLDHEAKEALADPEAGGWEDDGSGKRVWAREVCDPVESTLLSAQLELDGQQVSCVFSDHVLPAFFDSADKKGPWDRSGVLTGPFSLAKDGYAIVEAEDPNSVQQIWGDIARRVDAEPESGRFELVGEALPEWRRAGHEARQDGSRTAKRLVHSDAEGDADAGERTKESEAATAAKAARGKTDPEAKEPIPDELAVAAAAPPEQRGSAVEGEPQPAVGAGTALSRQDNVTDPGRQVTHYTDGSSSVHEDGAGAARAEGGAEDQSPADADADGDGNGERYREPTDADAQGIARGSGVAAEGTGKGQGGTGLPPAETRI